MRKAWLAAAIVLLIPSAIAWRTYLKTFGLQRPRTPVDAVQPVYAGYWRFLSAAKRVVPRDATYTIYADKGPAETELFMLSLGVFRDGHAVPRSYFGGVQPDEGRSAKYVLLYGSMECPGDAPLMTPVEGGAVCTRETP